MIDYRPDLFTQRQRLLDGDLPKASPSSMMSITIKRTLYPTPTRIFLRDSGATAEIPSDGLERFLFRGDSWQVDIEPLPLPPLSEEPSFSLLEDFPALRSRIEALEADPISEVEALSKVDHYLPRAFWTHEYVITPVAKYGRHHSQVFDIICVGVDTLDASEVLMHESFACHVVDYLQSVEAGKRCKALEYPSLLPCIARGLSWHELNEFMNGSESFKERLKLYMTFTREIDTIYRNALRSKFDGTADMSKVESDITKFLKREAVVSSYTDKWERDAIAEDLAWIASRNLGANPARVQHNGIAFEEGVAAELESYGYLVQRTPVTGDFGADLIAEKNELRYAIQCKSHAKPIGIKAVQEAIGARRYYKCDYGVVIASSAFTLAANELAQETGVILIAEASIGRLEAMTA